MAYLLKYQPIELYIHFQRLLQIPVPYKIITVFTDACPDLLSIPQGPAVTSTLPFWPPLFYQRQFSGSAAPAFLKGLPAFTILSSLSQNTLDKPYSNSVLSVAVGDVPYQHLLLINLQSPLSVNHFSVHCYSTVSNVHQNLLADCNDTVKSQCNFMCSK